MKTPHRGIRTVGLVGGLLSMALLTGCVGVGGESSSESAGGNAPAGKGGTSQSGAESFGLSPVESVTELVPADFKDKTITVAIYNDGAPQQFLENGKLVGIQPDFAQAVSEVAGLDFSATGVGTFDSIIPGLDGGRYDAAFADFGITKERQEVIDMVFQFVSPTGFAVQKGSDLSIDKQSDLCGVTVAAPAGSSFLVDLEAISGECTSAGNPALKVQTFPTQTDGILAVSNGRAQVYASTNDQLAYAAAKENSGLAVQPFEYNPVPMGIGVPKDSPLGPVFVEAIKELMDNGTYEEILDKWGISTAAITPDQVTINPL